MESENDGAHSFDGCKPQGPENEGCYVEHVGDRFDTKAPAALLSSSLSTSHCGVHHRSSSPTSPRTDSRSVVGVSATSKSNHKKRLYIHIQPSDGGASCSYPVRETELRLCIGPSLGAKKLECFIRQQAGLPETRVDTLAPFPVLRLEDADGFTVPFVWDDLNDNSHYIGRVFDAPPPVACEGWRPRAITRPPIHPELGNSLPLVLRKRRRLTLASVPDEDDGNATSSNDERGSSQEMQPGTIQGHKSGKAKEVKREKNETGLSPSTDTKLCVVRSSRRLSLKKTEEEFIVVNKDAVSETFEAEVSDNIADIVIPEVLDSNPSSDCHLQSAPGPEGFESYNLSEIPDQDFEGSHLRKTPNCNDAVFRTITKTEQRSKKPSLHSVTSDASISPLSVPSRTFSPASDEISGESSAEHTASCAKKETPFEVSAAALDGSAGSQLFWDDASDRNVQDLAEGSPSSGILAKERTIYSRGESTTNVQATLYTNLQNAVDVSSEHVNATSDNLALENNASQLLVTVNCEIVKNNSCDTKTSHGVSECKRIRQKTLKFVKKPSILYNETPATLPTPAPLNTAISDTPESLRWFIPSRYVVSSSHTPAASIQEKDKNKSEDEDESLMRVYRSVNWLACGQDHPEALAESESLASVSLPAVLPDLTVRIPMEIIERGYISNPQLECCIYAAQRFSHSRSLNDGGISQAGGYFLGEGTGCGKGRVIAASIWHLWNLGYRRHVWISVSSDLLQDSIRDLKQIGAGHIPVLDLGSVGLCDLDDPDNMEVTERVGRLNSLWRWHGEGVVFLTYALLSRTTRAKPKNPKRLKGVQFTEDETPELVVDDIADDDDDLDRKSIEIPTFSHKRTNKTATISQSVSSPTRHFDGPITNRFDQIFQWLNNRPQFRAPMNDTHGFKTYFSRHPSELWKRPYWLFKPEVYHRGGLVCFDEAHKAKNLIPATDSDARVALGYLRRNPAGSATGQAVHELQRLLPHCPVLYASATGATELRHMAYMTRLALWGAGAAFPNFMAFRDSVERGGVAAMECVAMDLKAAGMYSCRALSYADVIFNSVIVKSSPSFINTYNAIADLMTDIYNILKSSAQRALQCPSMPMPLQMQDGKATQTLASCRSHFWSAQQRVFKQLLVSQKVEHTVALAKDAVDQGYQVVISLWGTGEARTAEKLRSLRFGLKETEESDNLDAPPKKRKAPVKRKNGASSSVSCVELAVEPELEEFLSPPKLMLEKLIKGRLTVPVLAIPDDVIVALLQRLELIPFPNNPLDDLIDKLGGPKRVAELSGRTRRLVWDPRSNKLQYNIRDVGGLNVSRSGQAIDHKVINSVNLREQELFQSGKKKFAVITEAASAGISLHSDCARPGARPRQMICIELPWAADKAVQQFGRVHRSNQRYPPKYHLLVSDIGGERRFVACIARRMQTLGAITRGDRRAAFAGSSSTVAQQHSTPQSGSVTSSQQTKSALSDGDPETCPSPPPASVLSQSEETGGAGLGAATNSSPHFSHASPVENESDDVEVIECPTAREKKDPSEAAPTDFSDEKTDDHFVRFMDMDLYSRFGLQARALLYRWLQYYSRSNLFTDGHLDAPPAVSPPAVALHPNSSYSSYEAFALHITKLFVERGIAETPLPGSAGPSGGRGGPQKSVSSVLDKASAKEMDRFLNRLLLLPVKEQNDIFSFYTQIHDELVEAARFTGEYGKGVESLNQRYFKGGSSSTRYSVSILQKEVLWTNPTIGAQTIYFHLSLDRGIPWQMALGLLRDAQNRQATESTVEGFYTLPSTASMRTQKTDESSTEPQAAPHTITSMALVLQRSQFASALPSQRLLVFRPHLGALSVIGDELATVGALRRHSWSKCDDKKELKAIERCWTEQYEKSEYACLHQQISGSTAPCKKTVGSGTTCRVGCRLQEEHLLTGNIITLWGRLEAWFEDQTDDDDHTIAQHEKQPPPSFSEIYSSATSDPSEKQTRLLPSVRPSRPLRLVRALVKGSAPLVGARIPPDKVRIIKRNLQTAAHCFEQNEEESWARQLKATAARGILFTASMYTRFLNFVVHTIARSRGIAFQSTKTTAIPLSPPTSDNASTTGSFEMLIDDVYTTTMDALDQHRPESATWSREDLEWLDAAFPAVTQGLACFDTFLSQAASTGEAGIFRGYDARRRTTTFTFLIPLRPLQYATPQLLENIRRQHEVFHYQYRHLQVRDPTRNLSPHLHLSSTTEPAIVLLEKKAFLSDGASSSTVVSSSVPSSSSVPTRTTPQLSVSNPPTLRTLQFYQSTQQQPPTSVNKSNVHKANGFVPLSLPPVSSSRQDPCCGTTENHTCSSALNSCAGGNDGSVNTGPPPGATTSQWTPPPPPLIMLDTASVNGNDDDVEELCSFSGVIHNKLSFSPTLSKTSPGFEQSHSVSSKSHSVPQTPCPPPTKSSHSPSPVKTSEPPVPLPLAEQLWSTIVSVHAPSTSNTRPQRNRNGTLAFPEQRVVDDVDLDDGTATLLSELLGMTSAGTAVTDFLNQSVSASPGGPTHNRAPFSPQDSKTPACYDLDEDDDEDEEEEEEEKSSLDTTLESHGSDKEPVISIVVENNPVTDSCG